ncbi:MAG: DUF2177 family protein [Chloroflexi bacterium]|nr:DUF2177 family protein [Chloroflexota bacterium]
MSQPVVAVISVLVTMGILDAIWLTTMTARLYRREMPELLLATPMWPPAILFYLLYAVGVLVLVVLPALERDYALLRVAGTGALLGLVAYGTYDLTNHATLRGWSPVVTVVDLAWGTPLSAVVATVAVIIARRFA